MFVREPTTENLKLLKRLEFESVMSEEAAGAVVVRGAETAGDNKAVSDANNGGRGNASGRESTTQRDSPLPDDNKVMWIIF